MTRVIAVAACDAATLESGLDLMRRCAAMGVWAVELRLDFLPDGWLPVSLRARPSFSSDCAESAVSSGARPTHAIDSWVADLVAAAWTDSLAVKGGVPRLIATARRAKDSGHFPDDEDEARMDLLRQCFAAGCDVVDVERDVIARGLAPSWFEGASCRNLLPGSPTDWAVIESEHGTDILCRETMAWVESPARLGALRKWSFEVRSARQFDLTMRLVRSAPNALISPRGGLGVAARWFADWLEWPFVYASAPGSEQCFPALPAADAICRIAAQAMDANDRDRRDHRENIVGGVVGTAASRSLSPLLHHALHTGLDASFRYAPIQCERFSDALELASTLSETRRVCLSVTNPFKSDAAQVVAKDHGAALPLSVANTLWRDGAGIWRGSNTDATGFLSALISRRSLDRLAHDRVLVLGSGGGATSVVTALRGRVREIAIASRNGRSAKNLAMQYGVSFHPSPQTDDFGFDLVVNTTPCGQPGGPSEGASPVDLAQLTINPGALVFDLVYGGVTPFARQARSLGLDFEDGLSMLFEQAVLQRRDWGLDDGVCSAPLRRLIIGGLRRAALGGPWTPLPRIALVGYRGVGKSSAAARLASMLELPSIDLDSWVTNAEGASPGDIIAKSGESHFRALEVKHLRRVQASLPSGILATGGGIVESPEARRSLVRDYTIVWLRARPHTLLARLQNDTRGSRPALEPGGIDAELEVRFARREPWYRAVADHCIDTDNLTMDETVAEIVRWVDGAVR